MMAKIITCSILGLKEILNRFYVLWNEKTKIIYYFLKNTYFLYTKITILIKL